MKRKNNSKIIYRIIISVIILTLLFVLAVPSFALEPKSTSNYFSGYSSNSTSEALKSATNSEKDEQGNFTNPIMSGTPQITFLIPGLKSYARVWSNDYSLIYSDTSKGTDESEDSEGNTNEETDESEESEENATEEKPSLSLAYNCDSIVEKIRKISGAKVYLAEDKTLYCHKDTENTSCQHTKEDKNGDPLDDDIVEYQVHEHRFILKELPDICSCNKEVCTCVIKYDVGSYPYISKITDISQHAVILFSPSEAQSSNSRIYEQFNYIVDKIVYDYKTLNNGYLPKINLVAQSRGGLTAMQYALDHPYLVDTMITMGTPFSGSFLGKSEAILNLAGYSNNEENELYCKGVNDILNPSIYNEYKNEWNNNYEEKYSGIKFHAIGGATTLGAAAYIMKTDIFQTDHKTNFYGEVLARVDSLPLPDLGSYDEAYDNTAIVIYGDMFIHIDSQLAKEYVGVTRHRRLFTEDNINLNMRAVANLALPHNLEPGDALIHNYVIRELNFGPSLDENDQLIFNYYEDDNGGIVIRKLKSSSTETAIIIPSTIGGKSVVKIDSYAFANSDATSVYIPASVTEISNSAFEGADALTTVTFGEGSQLSIIGDYAFAGCSSLAAFTFPAGTTRIGRYAFADTAISAVTLGANVIYVYPTSFINTEISAYGIAAGNTHYSVSDGVLYGASNGTLIAYPTKKTGATFTLPAAISEISPYAFAYNPYISAVNLGDISELPDYAFLECSNLSTINAPAVVSSGIDTFEGTAFIESSAERKVVGQVLIKYSGTATEVYVDNPMIAPFAFNGCSSLEEITLGNNVVYMAHGAFSGCETLSEVNLCGDLVKSVGLMTFFENDAELKINVAPSLIDDYNAHTSWSPFAESLDTHETEIEFNSNGGSSEENISIEYYTSVPTLPSPTKTGYNFSHWTYTKDGETVAVYSGDLWQSYEDYVVFNAVYTPINYTITFNTEGSAVSNAYYTIESGYAQLPTSSRAGYNFLGWCDNAALEGSLITSIAVGEYGNKSLYAKWEGLPYTVTLDYNDGSTPTGSTTLVMGENYTLPTPTRVGYYFDGWKCQNELYTTNAGVSFSGWDVPENSTLTASWIVEKYYLHVNAGDGNSYWITEDGVSLNEASVTYGTTADDIFAIMQTINQEGRFLPTGKKVIYLTLGVVAEGTTPTVNFEHTVGGAVKDLGSDGQTFEIYPYYANEINFHIVFNGFATAASGSNINPITADYGEEITLWSPSNNDYVFRHWIVADIEENSHLAGTSLAPGTIFNYSVMPDLSINKGEDGVNIWLDAVYKTKVTYSVLNNSDKIVSGNIDGDASSFTFPTPNEANYIFNGWYATIDGSTVWFSDSNGALTLNSGNALYETDENGNTVYTRLNLSTLDLTLYASLTPKTFTITYVLNGGTNNSANPSTYTYGTAVGLQNPSRSGYRFDGWYTDSGFSTRIMTISSNASGHITVYAKFTYLYTVVFNFESYTETRSAGYNESVISPALTGALAGYKWTNGTSSFFGGSSYLVTGNTTFYFTDKTMSERYDASKGSYAVYNLTQLLQMNNSSAAFHLMNNIDITKSDSQYITNFSGVFDGQGYTLYTFSVHIAPSTVGNNSYGLVANNRGTLKNFTMSGYEIVIEPNSGSSALIIIGFVAGFNYGTIDNVHVTGCSVYGNRGTTSIGGIAGNNSGGTINRCTVRNVHFEGMGDMGGIVAKSSGGNLTSCKVYDLTFSIKLTGRNTYTGGIVGYSLGNNKVVSCTVHNTAISVISCTMTTPTPYVGKVIGCAVNSTVTSIGSASTSLNAGVLATGSYTHNPTVYFGARANQMIGYHSGCTIS